MVYRFICFLFFVSFIIVILNINYENADLVSLILSDFILVLVFSMVLYMLIKTIFPLNKILIEYNDYNLKIKTIRKVKEIKFEEIENIEIKTHGKLNSGKIIIFTNKEKYEVYPLKNLNEIKTIIDQIIL